VSAGSTQSDGRNGERWTVTVCHQCRQAGRHGDECPFPGDYVMSAEGDEVEVVLASEAVRAREEWAHEHAGREDAEAELDQLVTRLCAAAGEPFLVDALKAIEDRMAVLRRLRAEPSRCEGDDDA
jgi:hypothetical protein